MTTMSPLVLLTRVIVCVAGMTAAAFAYPHSLVLVMAAALLAAYPRTWTPAALMVGLAVVWLVQTELHPVGLTTVRLTGLALSLYYLHAGSAFAAVLPKDARSGPAVAWPMLRRVGVVTILTIAVALLVSALESLAGGTTSGTGGWIGELAGGLALAVGGAFFLIHLARRPS